VYRECYERTKQRLGRQRGSKVGRVESPGRRSIRSNLVLQLTPHRDARSSDPRLDDRPFFMESVSVNAGALTTATGAYTVVP